MNGSLGRLSSSAHAGPEVDNMPAAPTMAPPKNLRRDTWRVDSENLLNIASSRAWSNGEKRIVVDDVRIVVELGGDPHLMIRQSLARRPPSGRESAAQLLPR